MTSSLQFAQQLKARFGDLISEPVEFRGEWTVLVRDAERITAVCSFCKNELGFDFLADLSGVDGYGEDPRWTLVYELFNVNHSAYLRLKTSVGEEKGELPTVSLVWRTADWHEREVFDMMGVRFTGHPDLRRILMWEGYPYYPLRKDFPLAGKPTELPEVAFSKVTPLEGGPFVTISGGKDSAAREPRIRIPETDALEMNSRVERRDDQKNAFGKASGPGPIEKK
jgi:NADH-quinone oxidoreductase subunit C